jgi:hypothetical protein
MIVHIGLHKTGTTYLQKNVFPYLGVSYADYPICHRIFTPVVKLNDFEYDAEKIRPQLKYKLYSYESLSGNIYNCCNRKQIIDRLLELGFKKVIVGIRGYLGLHSSLYYQYLKEGGTQPRKLMFKDIDKTYLNYEPLLDYCLTKFDAVLVIDHNDMYEDLAEVISGIESFCGGGYTKPASLKSSNVSIFFQQQKILRLTNIIGLDSRKMVELLRSGITKDEIIKKVNWKAEQIKKEILKV